MYIVYVYVLYSTEYDKETKVIFSWLYIRLNAGTEYSYR